MKKPALRKYCVSEQTVHTQPEEALDHPPHPTWWVPSHLQYEGQHWDEGAGALREQRQSTHTVHAQGIEAGSGDQPGSTGKRGEHKPEPQRPHKPASPSWPSCP